ncbi:MAG: hypothetical protein AAGB26_01375 [Planctomycetota bacterium]
MQMPALVAPDRVQAEMRAERAKYQREIDRLELRLNNLSNKDLSADEERDRRNQLQEQIDRQRGKMSDARSDISDRYELERLNAQYAKTKGQAAALAWVQRSTWGRILLDLPKLFGCALIALFTLPVLADKTLGSHAKTFSIVACGVVLFAAVNSGDQFMATIITLLR